MCDERTGEGKEMKREVLGYRIVIERLILKFISGFKRN